MAFSDTVGVSSNGCRRIFTTIDFDYFTFCSSAGASPRGRGSLPLPPRVERRDGCIPGWAGEPSSPRPRSTPIRVHPRVGGGAGFSRTTLTRFTGASPRGRGSPHGAAVREQERGCIPAWAGEPRGRCTPSSPGGVHPRVGGGASGTMFPGRAMTGASPRGRGSQRQPFYAAIGFGCIPAWAGEPRPVPRLRAGLRVHPRVGGGAT